ncbi:UNVERIFIED_CONTAM: hypothetical protein GTU68_029206 [Idotea baltica]|nr:hypothetical protein [Idotea baltica]
MIFKCLLLLLPMIVLASWFQDTSKSKENFQTENNCFCQLKGIVDDCSCSIETIDSFNNLKIYPRLRSILEKDYFRYWKVNLNKGCLFWDDDSQCSIRYCSVQECLTVPESIEQDLSASHNKEKYTSKDKLKMLESDCDKEGDLGYLNTTISDESKADFERWAAHDSAQDDSFCFLDDETSQESRYVDLLLNPERYTGYMGPSAHRVWSAIYQENCFKSSGTEASFSEFSSMGEMCLEKRAFYRAISGLHSSINIHLCAKFLLSEKDGFLDHPEGIWGPNLVEFQKRFDPELTKGAGPNRLKNLYFLYLLELKALSKVGPYLLSLPFYTGNHEEDRERKTAITDLLSIIESFPHHFDEGLMFAMNSDGANLKTEFRDHFRNISRIMDCVGCDKCRLWGKLQVTGLGTALKILFSGKFDSISDAKKMNFHLTRNEIVALFNAFGR